jgi:hypothetical protein
VTPVTCPACTTYPADVQQDLDAAGRLHARELQRIRDAEETGPLMPAFRPWDSGADTYVALHP